MERPDPQQQTSGQRDTVSVQSEKTTQRRVSKPLLERRRRARINASLGELRALLLQFHVKQGCRVSKLEKADVLELTVQRLRSLQLGRSGEGGVFTVGNRVCWCRMWTLQNQRVSASESKPQNLQDITLSPAQHTQHTLHTQHTPHTLQHHGLRSSAPEDCQLSNGTYPDGLTTVEKNTFRKKAHNHDVEDGQLFYIRYKGTSSKSCGGTKDANAIFTEFHASSFGAHCGQKKTRDAISKRFYWPGMSSHMGDYNFLF
ncbi:uncharacterized protein [Hoplias malabaricus]|uniref:uncharacterized protein n=1 Tax=Hoplias malabaricus TaxID=27720 RepID=UPI003461E997